MRFGIRFLFALLIPLGLAGAAAAQQLMIYPKGGQDQNQQNKDKAECQVWATGQTGFDPLNPAAAAPQVPAEAPKGGAVRGAAKGAAAGAAIGAIAGDAGKGAAIGAAGGGMGGAARKRGQERDQEAAQAQAQAAVDQQRASFDRAMKTCLEGRNYSVN